MPTDYVKDPASSVAYSFDRSAYLAPGAQLSASAWEVPATLQKVNDSFDPAAATTTITLSGGVRDTSYNIYNLITSDDGAIYRIAFSLRVMDAADIREPSALEDQLAALRVAISEAAINGTAEYQIANRMKRRYSLDELLNYEKQLVARVNVERRAASGTGFFKNHPVRPVEPGP